MLDKVPNPERDARVRLWYRTTSAFLLAAGGKLQPFDDRYAWGVGGGLIGAALATFALTVQ